MTCKHLKEKFDDYVDEALDNAEATMLTQHIASCESCQELVNREHQLQSLLREYGDSSMPTPDATYFDQTLAMAAHAGARQQRKRSWLTGFGSAVAAGLAVWVVSGVLFNAPDSTPTASPLPTVTMALEEPRTINLVFSSVSALDDATLTVTLPDGVELAGFEGQRVVSWMTSLQEGKNLLPLRLIATMPTNGVLLATLRHGEDDREFRLQVNVS